MASARRELLNCLGHYTHVQRASGASEHEVAQALLRKHKDNAAEIVIVNEFLAAMKEGKTNDIGLIDPDGVTEGNRHRIHSTLNAFLIRAS
ncbi:MAG TPA: hypothetical protein VFT64_07825 [Rickettsiales bacterium]|nr:hypothetical protein [Rickettsiales bacterium]